MSKQLVPPFPYFGGKRIVASEVWRRLGNVANYLEPFCGSCAVLLARPHEPHIETVNDKDGFVANFWRACALFPDEVLHHADWPVNEADLVARHNWMYGQKESLRDRLMEDPDFCDTKIAGWWVWGISSWIGSEYLERPVNVSLPQINSWGHQGIHREGVSSNGRLPRVGVKDVGVGIHNMSGLNLLQAVQTRMRKVRVTCGDWTRILGRTTVGTHQVSSVGIFFDPPYDGGSKVYAENERISSKVREWCLEHGDHPRIRIALCGYEGEHEVLETKGWSVYSWKANGGYGSQSDGEARSNAGKERIWFSPYCQNDEVPTLF